MTAPSVPSVNTTIYTAQKLVDEDSLISFINFIRLRRSISGHKAQEDAMTPMVTDFAQRLKDQNNLRDFISLRREISGHKAQEDAMAPMVTDFAQRLIDQNNLRDFIELNREILGHGPQRNATTSAAMHILQSHLGIGHVYDPSHRYALGDKALEDMMTPMVASFAQKLLGGNDLENFIKLRSEVSGHKVQEDTMTSMVTGVAQELLNQDDHENLTALYIAILGNKTQEDMITPMVASFAQKLLDHDLFYRFISMNRDIARYKPQSELFNGISNYTLMEVSDFQMEHGGTLIVAFRHSAQPGQKDTLCYTGGGLKQDKAWEAGQLMTHWRHHDEKREASCAALRGVITQVASGNGPAAPAAQRALRTLDVD